MGQKTALILPAGCGIDDLTDQNGVAVVANKCDMVRVTCGPAEKLLAIVNRRLFNGLLTFQQV